MAISLEYGKCAGCGKDQSKALNNCRECGVALPWNKAAMKMQNSSSSSSSSPKMGIGDIAWAAMGVQILGGALVVAGIGYRFASRLEYLPRVPFLSVAIIVVGVMLWGIGSRMD